MKLDDFANTCDRCRFWEHHVDDALGAYGFCRRHAPRAITISKAAEFEARWPITHESEWCGEHQFPGEAVSASADPAQLSNQG